MELNEEQKRKIKQFVDQGLDLSGVQKKLADELNLPLTYLEVRFLLDDLGLELAEEKPRTAANHDITSPPPPRKGQEPETIADLEPVEEGVSVEVDSITKPGTVVSGKVTFSDGKAARWALDQMGRIMLEGAEEGYKPSQEDLAIFQQQLSNELQKQGF